MNFDGLRDAVVKMLVDERVEVNTLTFQNDMKTFCVKDDVLTLLVHLGYLAYGADEGKVFIPNNEILAEFKNAIYVGAGNNFLFPFS